MTRPNLSKGDPEWAAYKAQIVESANEVLAEMKGCGIDEIRALVDRHDIVFGVWQDLREPDGVGMLPIKGQTIFRDVAASGAPRAVSLAGIPCRSIEEAEALRLTIGEADRRH